MQKAKHQDLIVAVKDDDLAYQSPSTNTTGPILTGLFFVIFILGGFIAWASLAPLDEGIPTAGSLIVESKRKTITHLSGGVISAIKVHEGELVEAEQPLIELDETTVKANLDNSLQTYFSLTAKVARLKAEQSNAANISFPEELTSKSDHPLAQQHMLAQKNLFIARRSALEGNLAVLDQTVKINASQAVGIERQMAFLEQQLSGISSLAAEGYAAKNQQYELERRIAELKTNALQAKQSSDEARLRAIQMRRSFKEEVETQLADANRELASISEQLRVSQKEQERAIIRSPIKGYITQLAVHTVGAAITPGMTLMDIVPYSDKLVFEVKIPTNLIDKVRVGLVADINLHNFPDTPRLVIEGKLVSVSADMIQDNIPNNPPYYMGLVEVTPQGEKAMAGRQLQPGMQADVLIKTGERTLMTYLLKPMMRKFYSAFKES